MRNAARLILLVAVACTSAKAQSTPSGQEKMIMLNHIAMYVYDLKKSTDFYDAILQFNKADEPFKDGKHTWYDIGPTSRLHLIQGAENNIKRDKNDHLCFSVPDVQIIIRRLEKNNVPWFDWAGAPKSITNRVDGVKQIYFQDPDGHWIEINDDSYKKR